MGFLIIDGNSILNRAFYGIRVLTNSRGVATNAVTGFMNTLLMLEKDVDPESYVEEHGLKTVNDEGALEEVLKEVIAKNPKAIADYKGGKEKALGALVGQTMKAMKGKANPGMVNEKLREMLK